MGTIASLITSLTIVYSTVYSDADQRKHQSSASLAFVWGIHRGPVNSPHKWPVTRKMFPFDDVIMVGEAGHTYCLNLMPQWNTVFFVRTRRHLEAMLEHCISKFSMKCIVTAVILYIAHRISSIHGKINTSLQIISHHFESDLNIFYAVIPNVVLTSKPRPWIRLSKTSIHAFKYKWNNQNIFSLTNYTLALDLICHF